MTLAHTRQDAIIYMLTLYGDANVDDSLHVQRGRRAWRASAIRDALLSVPWSSGMIQPTERYLVLDDALVYTAFLSRCGRRHESRAHGRHCRHSWRAAAPVRARLCCCFNRSGRRGARANERAPLPTATPRGGDSVRLDRVPRRVLHVHVLLRGMLQLLSRIIARRCT